MKPIQQKLFQPADNIPIPAEHTKAHSYFDKASLEHDFANYQNADFQKNIIDPFIDGKHLVRIAFLNLSEMMIKTA